MNEEQEREKFEAWANNEQLSLSRFPKGWGIAEGYRNVTTQFAWEAWKAAVGLDS